MTHLRIEQNNGVIEEVSSSVISKLYEIAHAGLDVSSNLQGRLHTSVAYEDEIDWLTQTYTDLYINADAKYIRFADPEVSRILVSGWGDGVGITQTQVQSITNLNDVFYNNTSIQHFDDLNKLTGLTTLKQNEFRNCSNLVSVNLSGITNLEILGGQRYNYSFNGCTSLVYVIAPQLQELGSATFAGCTSLKIAIAKNAKYYNRSEWVFGGCPALKAIILPELVQTSYYETNVFTLSGDNYHPNGLIGDSSNIVLLEFGKVGSVSKLGISRYSPNIKALVLHGDNVMTLNGWSSGDPFTQWFADNSMIVYVEDQLLPSYQSDAAWSEYYADHVRGISQFNAADYLDQELLQIYNSEMGTSYSAS